MIVGLPSSGKTFLGDEIFSAHWHQNETAIFLDDMGVQNTLADLIRCTEQGYDTIIVADVYLCREESRKNALKRLAEIAPDYKVEWIFFENEPLKCLVNVDHRNDGRKVKEMIRNLSKIYDIPKGVETKKIWQPK